MTMHYEKPVLSLLGCTLSIVRGSRLNGNCDSFPESNFRKDSNAEEGLDD
jgi:hypothetical protein